MISLPLLYYTVFGFLCLAVLFIIGLDKALLSTVRKQHNRRNKIKRFKPQSRIIRYAVDSMRKFGATVRISAIPQSAYSVLTVVSAIGGYVAGKVVFQSSFLAVSVGILALLLPVIVLRLRQNRIINRKLTRLASSMMILSNSYLVTEDFLTTVQDNLPILDMPEPFRDFLFYATRMDSEVSAALRRLSSRVSNPYFSQWIDIIILAQGDRRLRYAAVTVVDAMHDVLQAQADEEAAMYAVWRDYVITLILIFCVPLVFKFLMYEAYLTMTTTVFGQGLLALLLAAVVFSVFRAVKINQPIAT